MHLIEAQSMGITPLADHEPISLDGSQLLAGDLNLEGPDQSETGGPPGGPHGRIEYGANIINHCIVISSGANTVTPTVALVPPLRAAQLPPSSPIHTPVSCPAAEHRSRLPQSSPACCSSPRPEPVRRSSRTPPPLPSTTADCHASAPSSCQSRDLRQQLFLRRERLKITPQTSTDSAYSSSPASFHSFLPSSALFRFSTEPTTSPTLSVSPEPQRTATAKAHCRFVSAHHHYSHRHPGPPDHRPPTVTEPCGSYSTSPTHPRSRSAGAPAGMSSPSSSVYVLKSLPARPSITNDPHRLSSHPSLTSPRPPSTPSLSRPQTAFNPHPSPASLQPPTSPANVAYEDHHHHPSQQLSSHHLPRLVFKHPTFSSQPLPSPTTAYPNQYSDYAAYQQFVLASPANAPPPDHNPSGFHQSPLVFPAQSLLSASHDRSQPHGSVGSTTPMFSTGIRSPSNPHLPLGSVAPSPKTNPDDGLAFPSLGPILSSTPNSDRVSVVRQRDSSSRKRTHSGVLEIRLPRVDSRKLSSVGLPSSSSHLEDVASGGEHSKGPVHHPFSKLPDHSYTNITKIEEVHRSPQSPRFMFTNPFGTTIHKRSPPPADEPTPSRKRNYQTHEGNLIFCFHGHFVSSKPSHSIRIPACNTRSHSIVDPQGSSSTTVRPDRPGEGSSRRQRFVVYLPIQTLGSFILLIGIGSLFLVVSIGPLAGAGGFGFAVLVVFCYSWMISFSSMIKTVGSDPGILPRGLDPSPEMRWKPTTDDQEKSGEAGEWELLPRWIKVEKNPKHYQITKMNKLINQPNETSEHLPEGHAAQQVDWIQSKWCSTCESYRPPRSSHCRICDCCIDGIDHHCSYLNTCIGARNYQYFFIFLHSCCLNLIIVIGVSLWILIAEEGKNGTSSSQGPRSFGQVLADRPIAVFNLLASLIVLLPISALTGYHIFLSLSGLTTVEYIKAQTTKRVIKENKKLLNDYYGQQERRKKKRQDGFNQDYDEDQNSGLLGGWNRLVLARICRPATETWIDWKAFETVPLVEE